MKKLFFLFIILFMACELSYDSIPTKIRYQAAGLMMDITIYCQQENGSVYKLNYTDWIGEFNYETEFVKPGTAHIIITNKDGGNIIGAIYKRGYKISYQVDPAFVELIEVIE